MRVLFVSEVDSTQRVAMEWVERGEREWDALCADHQTAGRGRYGACWCDEPGTSLLVSLVLWEVPLPEPPSLLGVAAAIATAATLEQLFPPLQVRLKYPNDLIRQGRKLGGVLVELAKETAVVGIGVNLAQREFPEPLRERAISVWQALHWSKDLASREVRTHLIERINRHLKALVAQLVQAGTSPLYALWQARDETPGRLYQALDLPGQPVGLALKVEPDFRLRLRLPDGSEHCTCLVQGVASSVVGEGMAPVDA
ncbi:MAG: biotin--[acetyl-CoA-carboxylase] ligase [Fimbriimonadales bacterium]|nr:biotin--[acetyl-CoA-carboxylase] ligase [Fimbriimonadales bacterium]